MAAIPDPTFEQDFSPDGFGDLSSVTTNGTTQGRQFNAADQVTGYDSSTNWVTPVYDAAGNMTVMPQPGNETAGLYVVYNAWNEPTKVYSDTGHTTLIAAYAYDGTGRLIESQSDFVSGVPQLVVHSYYAGSQVIETRNATGADAASQNPDTLSPTYQYVWSARAENAPILRDTYSSGSLVSDSRIYYLTDANGSVTAITDSSGNVLERYVYSPYGAVTIYSPDYSTVRNASSQDNTLLYDGTWQDPTTGLDEDGARWYNPSLETFVSQDPAHSDANLYRYVGNDPTTYTDPTGLETPYGGSGGGTSPIGSWSPPSNDCSAGQELAGAYGSGMYGDDSTDGGGGSFDSAGTNFVPLPLAGASLSGELSPGNGATYDPNTLSLPAPSSPIRSGVIKDAPPGPSVTFKEPWVQLSDEPISFDGSGILQTGYVPYSRKVHWSDGTVTDETTTQTACVSNDEWQWNDPEDDSGASGQVGNPHGPEPGHMHIPSPFDDGGRWRDPKDLP